MPAKTEVMFEKGVAETDSSSTTLISRTSAEIIVENIVGGLRLGQYSPGQRLSEPDLMRRHGVSRGPVREALRRLEAQGIVASHLHRGATIRLLSRKEMIEVLQLVWSLGSLAARLTAASIGSNAGKREFSRAFNSLLKVEGSADFFSRLQARESFFELLIRLSGNSELQRVFPTTQLQIARLQVQNSSVEMTRFKDYRRIGEAVLRGDADAAELALKEHIEGAISIFKSIPASYFLEE